MIVHFKCSLMEKDAFCMLPSQILTPWMAQRQFQKAKGPLSVVYMCKWKGTFLRSDRRIPPPQSFMSRFIMFSASPLLFRLHLTLMEKTYIAVWDKKRPHLSSNGACSWIMESQLLLTYTVCLFLISVTPFHASPFIKLKYSYTYISVETVRVVEIYHLFEKKKKR